MKKIIGFLFSMKLMAVLVFLFFLAIAIATGVETYYDTTTAQVLIYKSTWFELIIFLLFINLIANIFKYKLYRKGKIGSFIFHVAFLIIVIGSFITRNFGFEGVMTIREGSESNFILSTQTYLQIRVDDKQIQYAFDMPLDVSDKLNDAKKDLNKKFSTIGLGFLADSSVNFKHDIEFPGKENISIQYVDFIPNLFEYDTIYPVENGDKILHIVSVGEHGRKNNYLRENDLIVDDKGLVITYNVDNFTEAVQIIDTDSGFYVKSPYDMSYLQMSDQSSGIIVRDSLQPFIPLRLYTVGDIQFVFKAHYPSAEIQKVDIIDEMKGMNTLLVEVKQGNESKIVKLPGGYGIFPRTAEFSINELNYRLSFGSKLIPLPFSIFLRDFQLERYPGTTNPSSYLSEVTVIDVKKGVSKEHRIFMNNVLDYGGYRFFQSSYDQDELGTILSVNHDWLGTQITYLGYLLMAFGMVFTFFSKKSRFSYLLDKTTELRVKRESLKTIVLVVFMSFGLHSFTQEHNHTHHNHDSIHEHDHNHDHEVNEEHTGENDFFQAQTNETYIPIDKAHAEQFGRLIIQDFEGRFKPVHTLAIDILKKISRKESFEDLSAMQVFIGLHTDFQYWFDQPLIYVSGDSTRKLLNIDGKYAKMSNFYTEDGKYVLNKYVETALSKDPGFRNQFEKDFVKTDERFSILRGVMMGFYLKIFPIQNEPDNKWYTPADDLSLLNGDDSLFVNGIMTMYIYSVYDSRDKNDWTNSNKILGLIHDYQQKVADKDMIPSQSKISREIFYNKAQIFDRLTYYYLGLGLLLLIFQFAQIFKPKLNLKFVNIVGFILFAILFLFHGFGLGLRWYLSGHAPWSNGYEAIVFIAFVTVLSGLIFSKKSKIVLGAAGILAWLMLFVAHLNNMDPQISNLVPVLKSYWLMIHVAIITGSYAFLGLPALLGLINLLIEIFKTKESKKRFDLTSKELRYIAEMSMIIGLFMLTIGTFLGGIWANESWGRYWGWDAKETWALASVLVYTIILHFRFIPKMNGDFLFSSAALWGYGSIIMTFYGVNFYLSGLHSYATGEPVPIPSWVPITIISLAILNAMALIKRNKLKNAKPTEMLD